MASTETTETANDDGIGEPSANANTDANADADVHDDVHDGDDTIVDESSQAKALVSTAKATSAIDSAEEKGTSRPPSGDDEYNNNNNHKAMGESTSTTTERTTSASKRSVEPPSKERPPPPPPKRARTAYFIFADSVRPRLQTDHPGEAVGTQAKRIGAKWQSISDKEKDRFKAMAAAEKEGVVAALAAYQERFGDALRRLEQQEDTNAASSMETDDLVFPVARIRKIAKLDPEVKSLSKEALQLVVKSAELVLAKLGRESTKVARIQNRRTLLPDDVAQVCSHQEAFRFLKDDIRDLTKVLAAQKEQTKHHHKAVVSADAGAGAASATTVTKKEAARVAAAMGSKPLTSYFGAAVTSNK